MRDLLHLVAEERHAVRGLDVRRLDLDDVALHPEAPAPEHGVVPHVLAVDELAEHLVAVELLPGLEDEHALAPLLGGAKAVDARDRRDNHDVAAREERRGRGEPQARDVVVLGRVLLDVEVGLRDVGLGLVVVVVGDEVLDRVLREELAELVAELRGERLVVRDDERRALKPLDRPRHRRGLAGAGRAQDRLEAVALRDRRGDLLDRGRLVAHRARTRPSCGTAASGKRSRHLSGVEGVASKLYDRWVVRMVIGLSAVALAPLIGAPAAAPAAPPPTLTLVCKLPARADKLPPTARRGLIGHLEQYPVVRLASRPERARAQHLLAELVAAAERGRWRDLGAARRAGFDTRTAPRQPGDLAVKYFHAERHQEQRRGRAILDPRRPKALIYANAPGRPLVLVGAMWSTRDGELGPNPGGPITRWHSHVVCKRGNRRGLKPPAAAVPAGLAAHAGRERDAARLVHGRPPQRVRDPCARARALRRRPAAARPLPALAEVQLALFGGQRTTGRGQPLVRELEQLRDLAADPALPGGHGTGLRGRDDRPRVGLEGRRRERALGTDEEPRQLSVHRSPHADRPRPGGHDPASVRAEAGVVDRAEVAAEHDQRPAGLDVPEDDVVVATRRDQALAVG